MCVTWPYWLRDTHAMPPSFQSLKGKVCSVNSATTELNAFSANHTGNHCPHQVTWHSFHYNGMSVSQSRGMQPYSEIQSRNADITSFITMSQYWPRQALQIFTYYNYLLTYLLTYYTECVTWTTYNNIPVKTVWRASTMSVVNGVWLVVKSKSLGADNCFSSCGSGVGLCLPPAIAAHAHHIAINKDNTNVAAFKMNNI